MILGWVSPICLPRYDQLRKSYENVIAEVAGFGIYDIKERRASSELLKLSVPVRNTKNCAKLYENIAEISDVQICAGGLIGKDSCGGDSGGPLMTVESVRNQPPAYYLLGVVSFGTTICGSTPQPGIYTRIASYLKWILDNMHA